MIYKEFQDLKLSALGMGCMRLPVLNGDDAQVDEAATAAMVDEAMASGVNYYDTAWGYHNGNSELALGRALAKHPRDNFYLAFRSSRVVNGVMTGLRPAVIGMIGAAVVSVGQTVFLPDGLAAVTAYPLLCSLAIFALMAFLTHQKLHPIAIILLSALLGVVTGYLQPV